MKKLLKGLFLILNVLIATALLLSYLAPFVNPSTWFFPAIFGLAYPYLLFVNLIFVLYWLIRLKRTILISLVVILLGWNHLNNVFPLNFRESEIPVNVNQDRMFKVLSYNIRQFDLYHWSREVQVKEQTLDFIKKEDPDIVCFQEYYTSQRRGERQQDIERELGQLPENAVYYSTDTKWDIGIGIATFSRFPILKKSRIPFNTTYNAAMYTDIQFGEDIVRVFNVHLQSIRFREEDYAFMDTVRLKHANQQMRGIKNIGSQLKKAFIMRAEQSEIISNYIKDSPYPVIVMGDFNDTPHSYSYRKIKKGLHDAFRKSGKGFGYTYSGDLPKFRIDYILFSDPLVSENFKRIKKDYSDHFPITTRFYLPGEGNQY